MLIFYHMYRSVSGETHYTQDTIFRQHTNLWSIPLKLDGNVLRESNFDFAWKSQRLAEKDIFWQIWVFFSVWDRRSLGRTADEGRHNSWLRLGESLTPEAVQGQKGQEKSCKKYFGQVRLPRGRGEVSDFPASPLWDTARLPPLPSVTILNHRSQRHQPRSTPSKVEPSTGQI